MDNKKEEIADFVASLFAPLSKHQDENPSTKAFFAHDKHFFIMTEAGKPVYSRYGDEYELSTFLASFSAIIPKVSSFFQQHKPASAPPNVLKTIRSKGLLSVYKLKGKLVYIAVSKRKGETPTFLNSQIDGLHNLMISLLTSQIDIRLAERPGMDVRSQIDGWDSTLAMMVELTSKSPVGFLNSYPVLRMYSEDRAVVNNALRTLRPENCLLAMLMTSINVV